MIVELDHGAPWNLHHGAAIDLLRSMPDRSVDCCAMDPPFSADTHGSDLQGRRNDGGDKRKAIDFPPIAWGEIVQVSTELVRVVKAWIVTFGDLRSITAWRNALEAAGAGWIREGWWWKTDATPQLTGDRPAQGGEMMGLAHAPRPPKSGSMIWNGGGAHFRYQGPAQERAVKRIHPTQKPEWLMRAIVRDFAPAGGSVIDPYAGSGTTGVECIRAGLRFYGSELREDTHAGALARLRGAKHQPTLFGDSMPTEQIDFLKGTK